MVHLDFTDKTVSYDTFVNDLAERIADVLTTRGVADVITQRTAYRIFGRANVDRWRRELKITPMRRPGKLEYRTEDLRRLQKQDY